METLIPTLLESLQTLLARLGVPEASRPLGAMLLLYLAVTLLVLALLLLRWRIARRRKKSGGEDESGTGEAPSTGAVSDVAEAVAAETTEPVSGADVTAAEAMAKQERVVDEPSPATTGVVRSVRAGLQKTRASLVGRLEALFGSARPLGPDLLEELEEILITSDFGMQTTMRLVNTLEQRFAGQQAGAAEVYTALREEITLLLKGGEAGPELGAAADGLPTVVMVVGVNGVGKTTTIGKLASRYAAAGKSVLLAAGDTFRAAAAEQLTTWAERAGAEIVRHDEGGDPAAVTFDAARAAVARKADLLIVDTAGRLHTKTNLMEELKKVRRVLGREIAGAPHRTLLVVDATTGQNALTQTKMFREAVQVDGVVLTKLDGTAKGGIVVAIAAELGIPVDYVGVGEGVQDLRPFDADEFVAALFEKNEVA